MNRRPVMKRTFIVLAALLGLSACGTQNKELPMVHSDDPVLQLNPDRWQADSNDLITPPGDGTRHARAGL